MDKHLQLWTKEMEVSYEVIENDEEMQKIADAMIAYARIVPMDMEAIAKEFEEKGCETEVTESGMMRIKQGADKRLDTTKHYNRFVALSQDEKRAFQLTYTVQDCPAGLFGEEPCQAGQLTVINNAGHPIEEEDIIYIAGFFIQADMGKPASMKTPDHVRVIFQKI